MIPRSHERRLQALALAGGLPAVGVSLVLLAREPWPPFLRILLGVTLVGAWILGSRRIHQASAHSLQTLANLLASLRAGDFATRARRNVHGGAMEEVNRELNAFADTLQDQRFRALEAAALMRAVVSEIEVGVLAFDETRRLCLLNPYGETLLGMPQERALGHSAVELGLDAVLRRSPREAGPMEGTLDLPPPPGLPAPSRGGPTFMDLQLPGRTGRFELHLGSFRQGGRPHQLLVLSDLTRPLQEEERRAWQRLIRVLGHEINNSLAPIQSLSDSLARLLERHPDGWEQDLHQGLDIIAGRAQSLNRFMEGYTRLARLPEPRRSPVEVGLLLQKVAGLEQRLPVRLDPGPPCRIQADADQLEQALINLVANAVEASLETGGSVALGWLLEPGGVEIHIEDEGPGLPSGGNLFVPFFTTKPRGSGIGLALARRIAEGHQGSLWIENRSGARGARAVMRLPDGA